MRRMDTKMDFLELASSRFSVREFEDKPIDEQLLRRVLEAGRVAPSACNRQPQRVYVVESEEMKQRLAAVCRFTFGAPVVLAVCYDTEREWKNKLMGGKGSGEADAAIVATQMMLAAHECGLGSCWVGYFQADAVREALRLPETVVVSALLPMGYPRVGVAPFYMHGEYRPYEETIEKL